MTLDPARSDLGGSRRLSVGEVARLAGVSEQAIRLQLSQGGLAGQRVQRGGRLVWSVAEADAQRYAAAPHRQVGPGPRERLTAALEGAGAAGPVPGETPAPLEPSRGGVDGGAFVAGSVAADDAGAARLIPGVVQAGDSQRLSARSRVTERGPAAGRIPGPRQGELVGAARRMLQAHRRLLAGAYERSTSSPADRDEAVAALAGAYEHLIDACDALLEGYGPALGSSSRA